MLALLAPPTGLRIQIWRRAGDDGSGAGTVAGGGGGGGDEVMLGECEVAGSAIEALVDGPATPSQVVQLPITLSGGGSGGELSLSLTYRKEPLGGGGGGGGGGAASEGDSPPAGMLGATAQPHESPPAALITTTTATTTTTITTPRYEYVGV